MADLPKQVTPAKAKRGSRADRDYTSLHEKLRKLLLARFPICQICYNAFACIAHHLVRPATQVEDYQAVCRTCHRELHQGRA